MYKAIEKQSTLTTGGIDLASHGQNVAEFSHPPSHPQEQFSHQPSHSQEQFSHQPPPPQYSINEPVARFQPPALVPPLATTTKASSITTPPLSAESGLSSVKRMPPPIPPRLIKAIALYDYEGERDTDLTFKKGDLISIVHKTLSVDDWWKGQIGK